MVTFPDQCQSTGTSSQLLVSLIQTLMAAHCAISPRDMWPDDYGTVALKQGLSDYDFIVVGSGSSGAIVAARLSEITDWKILLLEAGPAPPIEEEIPGFQGGLYGSDTNWGFHAESTTACLAFPGGCQRPRGKMLGGSSGINTMQYLRGHPHDYNTWSDLGNTGWDYENVLKYLNKFENNTVASIADYDNGKYHGTKGPILVGRYDNNFKPFEDVYLEAMSEIGIPTVNDINADSVIAAADIEANLWHGRRQSSAKAYLIPAKNRSNLHIIYNAEVTKIVIDDNNRATGVEFVYQGNQKLSANVTKEVVLSAGSHMSPKVLMLSGIGPKADLEAVGIPVKSDLAVGKNYIEHLLVRLFFTFDPQNIPTSYVSQEDELYKLLMFNTGSLATRPLYAQMTGFMSSSNRTDFPDIQLHYYYFGLNSDFTSTGYTSYNSEMKAFLEETSKTLDIGHCEVNLVQPKSRGYLKLNATDVNGKPVITPLQLTEEDDVQAVIRSINKILALLDTKPFKQRGGKLLKVPLPACDPFEYKSDDYWRCYAHQLGYPPSHTVGTSKMGPDSDPDAVVNPRLLVRGIKGLRQIDGGIMPTVTSGNTNAPCFMIGEKGADLIKEDYGRL